MVLGGAVPQLFIRGMHHDPSKIPAASHSTVVYYFLYVWESFAYDISNEDEPHFFVTEDSSRGALRRFTPFDPDWDNEWGILQGAGVVDYLLLNFDQSMTNGTFTWTTDLNAARQNAFALFPNTEGIDAFARRQAIIRFQS